MGSPTPAKPRRASRTQIRVWAWTVGAFSFLAPWALFGLSPRPVANAAPPATQKKPAKPPERPVVLVITKKIVVGAATSSSTSSSTSSGPINYVYAPAPAAPAAVSCATPPC